MPAWSVFPRGQDLVRNGDPARFWSSLTVVERHNVTGASAGAWSLTARNEGLGALLTAGNGAILFRGDDEIMSGPITSIQRGAKESTISGIADTDDLDDRILFPTPGSPITAQSVAYDNRSGPASTVILGYVSANLGPAATADRRNPYLRLPSDPVIGSTVSLTGRLDGLRDVVSDLAESGGLHFEILHMEDTDGPFLQLSLRAVRDRSADIRFGTAGKFTGGVVGSDWSYTLTRPDVTRPIVAGGGQGNLRKFVTQVDTAAETAWGVKREQLVDQRQTSDATELAQAAKDALSDGAQPVSVSFTITDSPDIRYRRDWRVGDRVAVSVDGLDLTNVVREVTTTVTTSEGGKTETISAVVGTRDSSAWVTKTNRTVAKALRAIDKLKAI